MESCAILSIWPPPIVINIHFILLFMHSTKSLEKIIQFLTMVKFQFCVEYCTRATQLSYSFRFFRVLLGQILSS
jgi:hypothetical protein